MTTPSLTSEQQAAVLCIDRDLSLLAGAGSGKTLVLVEKIALLNEKLHVSLDKILIVTFSEKAAEEMQTRLQKRLGMGAQTSRIAANTIHGFASWILAESGSELSEFSVMEDSLARLERIRSAREGLLEALEGEDASEALSAVERFGFGGAQKFFVELLDRRITDEEHEYVRVFTAIRARYRHRKESLRFLDFDDLEDRLLHRLREDELFRESLQKRFSWIFVDEFQDTSPIQWEILKRIHHAPDNKIVIVGDPRQSIYRFRGADPSLFLKVTEDILKNGGRRFDLSQNFRSTSPVIDFVNAVSSPLFESRFPDLVASRKDPGYVEHLPVPRVRSSKEMTIEKIRTIEAETIAQRLRQLREEGHVWKSMALLFRTRKAVALYKDVFARMNIPCRTSLGEPLLERPEILSALFLLKKYAGPSDRDAGFVSLGLSHSPLKNFTENLAEDLKIDPLSVFLEAFFEKIRTYFPEEVHPNLSAFQKLTGQLMSLGVNTLNDLLSAIDILREEGRVTCPPVEISEDAVRFMTVHAAKGLEFPVVALCDLQAGPARPMKRFLVTPERRILLKELDEESLGLKNKLKKGEDFLEAEADEQDEEREESKRLLYVAMTRARDRLLLPLPAESAEPTKKGKVKKPDTWGEWLKRGE